MSASTHLAGAPTAGAAGTAPNAAAPDPDEARRLARRDQLIAQAQERSGRGRGIAEYARWVKCPRCHAWTAWGLDGLSCAFEVAVDPAALSPLGEAVAIARGHTTWSLDERGGRLWINHRDDFRIAGHPAGTLDRGDVVTRHRCGQPWPTTGPLAAEQRLPDLHARRAARASGADPPF